MKVQPSKDGEGLAGDIVPSAATREQIASAAGRRFAPKWLRAYILERDGFACRYCHTPLTDATANMDHVEPWPYGLTTPDNLVAACRICNYAKRSRKPGRWGLTKADKRLIRSLRGLKPGESIDFHNH